MCFQPCQPFNGPVAPGHRLWPKLCQQTATGRNAMATYTWDHIHLRTPDQEATAQWFERVFGAQVTRSTVLGKPRIDMKLGGANIFLAEVKPSDGVNAAPTTPYQIGRA